MRPGCGSVFVPRSLWLWLSSIKRKNPAQSIYQHHQSLIHYELTQQLMSMKTMNLKTLIFLKNKEVIIERWLLFLFNFPFNTFRMRLVITDQNQVRLSIWSPLAPTEDINLPHIYRPSYIFKVQVFPKSAGRCSFSANVTQTGGNASVEDSAVD